MKKRLLLLTGAAVITLAVITSVFTSGSNDPLDSLMQNIEALAQDEGILDYQIYDVYAYSSTSWRCDSGGSSACPAP